jgi:hypothetical protein
MCDKQRIQSVRDKIGAQPLESSLMVHGWECSRRPTSVET